MRPFLIILAAIALAAVAFFCFTRQAWVSGTAFLAGSLALVLPALAGRGLGSLGDAELLIDFVRNPFGTAVETAVDHLSQTFERPSEKTATDQQANSFDADAAFARYMARRNVEGAAPESSSIGASDSVASARTFGRKRV